MEFSLIPIVFDTILLFAKPTDGVDSCITQWEFILIKQKILSDYI